MTGHVKHGKEVLDSVFSMPRDKMTPVIDLTNHLWNGKRIDLRTPEETAAGFFVPETGEGRWLPVSHRSSSGSVCCAQRIPRSSANRNTRTTVRIDNEVMIIDRWFEHSSLEGNDMASEQAKMGFTAVLCAFSETSG